MKRAALIAVVLGLLSASLVFAARDIQRSCDVLLVWGDVQGVTTFTEQIRSSRISPPVPSLVVLFEAADGTVRLIQADNCRVLAKITRN